MILLWFSASQQFLWPDVFFFSGCQSIPVLWTQYLSTVTEIHLDSKMNWLHCGGQMSRGHIYKTVQRVHTKSVCVHKRWKGHAQKNSDSLWFLHTNEPADLCFLMVNHRNVLCVKLVSSCARTIWVCTSTMQHFTQMYILMFKAMRLTASQLAKTIVTISVIPPGISFEVWSVNSIYLFISVLFWLTWPTLWLGFILTINCNHCVRAVNHFISRLYSIHMCRWWSCVCEMAGEGRVCLAATVLSPVCFCAWQQSCVHCSGFHTDYIKTKITWCTVLAVFRCSMILDVKLNLYSS